MPEGWIVAGGVIIPGSSNSQTTHQPTRLKYYWRTEVLTPGKESRASPGNLALNTTVLERPQCSSVNKYCSCLGYFIVVNLWSILLRISAYHHQNKLIQYRNRSTLYCLYYSYFCHKHNGRPQAVSIWWEAMEQRITHKIVKPRKLTINN